jgi:hypothetical protein
MIVWLASYPRSGNTLLRIALNRMYGARSSVVYERDGVAERVGAELVGFEEIPEDRAGARRGGVSFIKTHRQRDGKVAEEDAAIYVVRDGRDALVSYARLLSEREPATYEARLREVIEEDSSTGTGGWGVNVLSWIKAPLRTCAVVRFEDLARDPAAVVRRAVERVAPPLEPKAGANIPSFDELAKADAGFFRRGLSGVWREEMPAQIQDLFWKRAGNREAMELLGYN